MRHLNGLLCGAALLLLASPVKAADVYIAPEPPVADQPWYVSIHGGIKFNEDWDDSASQSFDLGGPITLDVNLDGEVSTDDGAIFGAAVGYGFNDFFRAEVEVNWLGQDLNEFDIDTIDLVFKNAGDPFAEINIDCNDPVCSLNLGGDVSIWTGMINAILQVPFGRIIPYLGIGAGFAHVDLNGNFDDLSIDFDDTDTSFAVQGIAGIDVGITENIGIGVRGRILHIGDVEVEDSFGFHHDLDPDMFTTAEAVLTVGF